MKSLLIVAHGSRRKASNEEVRQLTAQIREKALDSFQQIECAFLELAYPSIEEAIDNCIENDIKKLVIFPYFLSSGKHVINDIPEIIKKKKQQYQKLDITLTLHLGKLAGLQSLILKNLI